MIKLEITMTNMGDAYDLTKAVEQLVLTNALLKDDMEIGVIQDPADEEILGVWQIKHI